MLYGYFYMFFFINEINSKEYILVEEYFIVNEKVFSLILYCISILFFLIKGYNILTFILFKNVNFPN